MGTPLPFERVRPAPMKLPDVRILFEYGYLRQIGTPMLLCAVVLFVSAMAMLGDNVSQVRTGYASVQRSNAALLDIAEINTQVMGIDMTVRGYALTGNPVFLHYEADNRELLRRAMDDLASLIAGEAGHSVSMATLRQLVARHEAVFAKLSDLGPGHGADVAAAITDPAKREARYAVQRALTALHADELKLLDARRNAAERQASRTFEIAFGIVFLAFVASALGFALVLHKRSDKFGRIFHAERRD